MSCVVPDNCVHQVEVILRKIIKDFERLDAEIDSAIAVLEAGNGEVDDLEALQRAKEAARNGAAIARRKLSCG